MSNNNNNRRFAFISICKALTAGQSREENRPPPPHGRGHLDPINTNPDKHIGAHVQGRGLRRWEARREGERVAADLGRPRLLRLCVRISRAGPRQGRRGSSRLVAMGLILPAPTHAMQRGPHPRAGGSQQVPASRPGPDPGRSGARTSWERQRAARDAGIWAASPPCSFPRAALIYTPSAPSPNKCVPPHTHTHTHAPQQDLAPSLPFNPLHAGSLDPPARAK